MIVNTFRAMIDLAPCYSPLLDRFVQKKKKSSESGCHEKKFGQLYKGVRTLHFLPTSPHIVGWLV